MHNLSSNLTPEVAPFHPPISSLTDPTLRSTLSTAPTSHPNGVAPSQTSSGQSRRQRAEEKEKERQERGERGEKAERVERRGGGGDDLQDKIVALQRRLAGGSGLTARTRDPLRKTTSTTTFTSNRPTKDPSASSRGQSRSQAPEAPASPSSQVARRDRGEGRGEGRYRDRGEGRGERYERHEREVHEGRGMLEGELESDGRVRDEYSRDRDGDRTRTRTRTRSPDHDHDFDRGDRTDPGRRTTSKPAGGSTGPSATSHQRRLAPSKTWDGPRIASGAGQNQSSSRGRIHEFNEEEEESNRARSPGLGQGNYSDELPEREHGRLDGYVDGDGWGTSSAAASGTMRRGGRVISANETLSDVYNGSGSTQPGGHAQISGRGPIRRTDSAPLRRNDDANLDSDEGDPYAGRNAIPHPKEFGSRGGGEGGMETVDRIRRDVDRLYRPGQQSQGQGQSQGHGQTQGRGGQGPQARKLMPAGGSMSDVQSRSATQSQEQGYQGQGPMRKLFDPTKHDPVNFGRRNQGAMSTSTGTGTASVATGGMYSSTRTGGSGSGSVVGDPRSRALRQGSSLATSISVESRPGGPQDPKGSIPGPNAKTRNLPIPLSAGDLDEDVVADKERERRKRREGSERGSQKKRDETSRGSRSSEGSESLKDRERGRGKSDTGIMSRLREAYKFIQGLETSLTEMHRKMSADPSNGVRALITSGALGQTHSNGINAPIFNPAMGQGAIGVLRQAEDDEDGFDRSKPLPTAASRLAGQQGQAVASDSDREDQAWVELIAKHKRLSDAHHDFLSLSLDPLIPASLHTLPVRYNIAARLWQVGFHLLLERMRYTWIANAPSNQTGMQHAFSANSRIAGSESQKDTLMSQRVLEHLTDFIYDAYSFYTNLLEEQVLSNFKTAWIEALGDLARYRMAVASQVASSETLDMNISSSGARIDDIDAEDDAQPFPSGASIGAEVAQSWNLEERETWRTTARDWYVMGLTDKPGEGRLHHHLALLCRDVKGEEVRGLYHFAKSLSTSHPFPPARESILPLFDNALQKRRAAPEANAPELFVLLHGMLFTRIELDTFDAVFDRYMERLEEDARMAADEHVAYGRKPMSQTQWLLMAIVNLSALMQYGAEDGFVRKALAEDSNARKINKTVQAAGPQTIAQNPAKQAGLLDDTLTAAQEVKSSEEDVETPVIAALKKLIIEPHARPEDSSSFPSHFQKAIKLCFTVLEFCLKHPVRHLGLHIFINPYITVFLTFLGTATKQNAVHAVLERFVPWNALVDFYNTIPRKIDVRPEVSPKLMGGPPIPEDWCVRGMEWVGRRVYERGFWKVKSNSGGARGSGGPAEPKSGPLITSEMDVLLGEQDITVGDAVEGVVDDADGQENIDSPSAVTQRRWRRIAWAGASLAACTPGLDFTADNNRKLCIVEDGPLARKIDSWQEEAASIARDAIQRQRKEEEARGEWAETETVAEAERADSDEDETQDPELRELRARRRYLRSLLVAPQAHPQAVAAPSAVTPKSYSRPKKASTKISVLPGFTVLVFDTNVLLSSLELLQKLVGSRKWTVVIPLPVITELDGLCKQPGDLGLAATKAVSYLEAHIRMSAISLKVQTSKGNYLSDLVVRTESLDRKYEGTDLDAETIRAQTMDDFILRVAVFQLTNFNDRSAILGVAMDGRYDDQKRTAPKVMLLTFDRNLRLRARARGVEAADDKEMAKILSSNG